MRHCALGVIGIPAHAVALLLNMRRLVAFHPISYFSLASSPPHLSPQLALPVGLSRYARQVGLFQDFRLLSENLGCPRNHHLRVILQPFDEIVKHGNDLIVKMF